MSVAFEYKVLAPEHAAVWQALRVIGARDFPMGFLLTVAETEAGGVARAADILGGGAVRGIFAGAELAGFCGVRRMQPERINHRVEIGPFFVASKWQGQGAAAEMMQGVIAEARAAGLAQVELFVDTENLRAIAFYERHGFVRAGTHLDSVRIDGISKDDHFYRLVL